MLIKNKRVKNPFFSICIPQHNRTSFLLESLKSFSTQTFKNFEVCISDGFSTDKREQEILEYLEQSDLSYVYMRSDINLKYDSNLRSAISLASGEYCFLCGNDDSLSKHSTLESIYNSMKSHKNIGVVVTNYEDWKTGSVICRVSGDRVRPGSPTTAAKSYRNTAFVSGILLHRQKAQSLSTDRWDGSEMYQMYLMASILSSGMDLLELSMSAVKKDIQIEGEAVDGYQFKKYECRWFEFTNIPLIKIGELVFKSIRPYIPADDTYHLKIIFKQLLIYTYPYWIVEYRRVASWKYAFNLFISMNPNNLLNDIKIGFPERIQLDIYYYLVCGTALIVPKKIFFKCQRVLHKIAKRKHD